MQVACRLWVKHEGLPRPYPLVCHLLDTAAMAGALWDVWTEEPGAERACERTGKAPQELRQLVSFWAGLHDIGKISPPFQVKVPELYHGLVQREPGYGTEEVSAEDRRLHHSEATHLLLPEVLNYPTNLIPQNAGRAALESVADVRFLTSGRRDSDTIMFGHRA